MTKLNQESVNEIEQLLSAVVPRSWVYALETRNSSTLFLNVTSIPSEWEFSGVIRNHVVDNGFASVVPETRSVFRDLRHQAILRDIWCAMNRGLPENSSYMDVGWRNSIHFGWFGSPLVRT